MERIRSCFSIVSGLPCDIARSAPAIVLSRPAQRLSSLRPARSLNRRNDPFHRRLQQLRYLHCCFDCYRVERTSSRAGVPPAEVQRLSRRTVTPTRFLVASLEPVSGLSDAWLGYSVVPISRSAEWVRYRIQQPGRTRRPLPVGGKAVYILAAVRETKNLPATALPTRSRLRSEGGHLTTYSLTDTVITIACRKQ